MKKIVGTLLLTTLGAIFGAGFYGYYFQKSSPTIKTVYLRGETAQPSFSYQQPSPTSYSSSPNFTTASEKARPARKLLVETIFFTFSGTEKKGTMNTGDEHPVQGC